MKILFDLAGRIQSSSITVYAKRLLAGFSENHYKDICILCSPEIYDDIKKSFPEYTCIKLNQIYNRLSFRHIFTCRSLIKKTDYDLTRADLSDFFYFEIQDRRKIQRKLKNQEEMS